MFGLFRNKNTPDGAVEIGLEILIQLPPAEVYRHLDWADPKHTLREQGHAVETIDPELAFFRLTMPQMPGHNFDFAVIEAEPARRYTVISETTPMIGRLVSVHTTYELQPADSGRACLVKANNAVQFVAGLTEKQFHEEVSRMSLACHNSLAKLKIHAEYGPEAVKAAHVAKVERPRVGD